MLGCHAGPVRGQALSAVGWRRHRSPRGGPMSTALRVPFGVWMRANPWGALVVVAGWGMALAMTVLVLLPRVPSAQPALPVGHGAAVHLSVTDDGCRRAHPGQPC